MHYEDYMAKFEHIFTLLELESKNVDARIKSCQYAKVTGVGFALIGGFAMSLGVSL